MSARLAAVQPGGPSTLRDLPLLLLSQSHSFRDNNIFAVMSQPQVEHEDSFRDDDAVSDQGKKQKSRRPASTTSTSADSAPAQLLTIV